MPQSPNPGRFNLRVTGLFAQVRPAAVSSSISSNPAHPIAVVGGVGTTGTKITRVVARREAVKYDRSWRNPGVATILACAA
jgi:hypothetical protein